MRYNNQDYRKSETISEYELLVKDESKK